MNRIISRKRNGNSESVVLSIDLQENPMWVINVFDGVDLGLRGNIDKEKKPDNIIITVKIGEE